MQIEYLEKCLKTGVISKIVETELPRYLNFFEKTSKENYAHAQEVLKKFPRWSIISGYYAMHDVTKLFLAKHFHIKVDFKVHKTTIELIRSISPNKEISQLLKEGYDEFIAMANDLADAKEERIKAQYYTGSEFMKEKYQEKAIHFINEVVNPYLEKMQILITEREEKGEENESESL